MQSHLSNGLGTLTTHKRDAGGRGRVYTRYLRLVRVAIAICQ
jgi:hypothetical protein